MKNKIRVAAILAGVLASGAAFSNTMTTSLPAGSGTQGAGGVVEFSGEIVDNSCNVSSGNTPVKVDLGKWSKSYFTAVGDETTKTPFKIDVTNCPASVKTVAVLFDGQKDANDQTLLAVSGPATGVGIKIYNGSGAGNQVKLGSVSDSVPVVPGSPGGTATVPFFADYSSTTANVTPGAANGVANFLMVYN